MSSMPEEKVKKLDRLLSLLDPENALSKSDFVESFKKVVDLILKIQARQEQAIQQLFAEHSRLAGERKQEYDSNFKDLRGQVNELFVGDQLKRMDSETKSNFKNLRTFLDSVVDQKLRDVDHRMSKVKDGEPGPLGPPGPIGPMPKEHLVLMKEVKEELEKVKNVLSNIPRGKAMGRAKVPIMRPVNLSSQL